MKPFANGLPLFKLIFVVYFVFNGAHRLEKCQMSRYGDNKEYNDYANKTLIIIPLI